MTNAGRHAQARRIDVRVTREAPAGRRGDRVDISVADDGIGMDSTRGREGFGLAGMRERLELLGGEFHLHGEPGEGVVVTASLPLTGGSM